MTELLLDTNIISYILKKHPLGELYRTVIHGNELCISFMTVAEIVEGACRIRQSSRKYQEILNCIRPYKVIHSNPRICDCWGEIRAVRYRQPISVADAWVAATALAYDLPLVTHNAKDFAGIGDLKIITKYQA